MRAVVLGATGLIGGFVLKKLLEEAAYSSVRVLVRRVPEGFPHESRKLQIRVVDFTALDLSDFLDSEHVYCCLGTTLRQAGSQEAFRKVDLDLPTQAASLAARAGAQKFLLVSSVGAQDRSGNFYLRIKGQAEAAVSRSGIPEVHHFRPSFLLGERAGPHRPLEKLGIRLIQPLAPLMIGPARIYRPIHASIVAQAMVACALAPPRPGSFVHEGAGLGS